MMLLLSRRYQFPVRNSGLYALEFVVSRKEEGAPDGTSVFLAIAVFTRGFAAELDATAPKGTGLRGNRQF